jgi:hypothetical protein
MNYKRLSYHTAHSRALLPGDLLAIAISPFFLGGKPKEKVPWFSRAGG